MSELIPPKRVIELINESRERIPTMSYPDLIADAFGLLAIIRRTDQAAITAEDDKAYHEAQAAYFKAAGERAQSLTATKH